MTTITAEKLVASVEASIAAHRAGRLPVERDQPVEIVCPTVRCGARAWRMPDGNTYCEHIGGAVVVADGSPGDLYDPARLEDISAPADELLAKENAGITDDWREDR